MKVKDLFVLWLEKYAKLGVKTRTYNKYEFIVVIPSPFIVTVSSFEINLFISIVAEFVISVSASTSKSSSHFNIPEDNITLLELTLIHISKFYKGGTHNSTLGDFSQKTGKIGIN